MKSSWIEYKNFFHLIWKEVFESLTKLIRIQFEIGEHIINRQTRHFTQASMAKMNNCIGINVWGRHLKYVFNFWYIFRRKQQKNRNRLSYLVNTTTTIWCVSQDTKFCRRIFLQILQNSSAKWDQVIRKL